MTNHTLPFPPAPDSDVHPLDLPRPSPEICAIGQAIAEAYEPNRHVRFAYASLTGPVLTVTYIEYHCSGCIHDWDRLQTIELPLVPDLVQAAHDLAVTIRQTQEALAAQKLNYATSRRARAEILLLRSLALKWPEYLNTTHPLPSLPDAIPQIGTPLFTYNIAKLETEAGLPQEPRQPW